MRFFRAEVSPPGRMAVHAATERLHGTVVTVVDENEKQG